MLPVQKLEADWSCDKHGAWFSSNLQSARLTVDYRLLNKHSNYSSQWLLITHNEKLLWSLLASSESHSMCLLHFLLCTLQQSYLQCCVLWCITNVTVVYCTQNYHSYTLLDLMCMFARFHPVGRLIIEHVIIVANTTHQILCAGKKLLWSVFDVGCRIHKFQNLWTHPSVWGKFAWRSSAVEFVVAISFQC